MRCKWFFNQKNVRFYTFLSLKLLFVTQEFRLCGGELLYDTQVFRLCGGDLILTRLKRRQKRSPIGGMTQAWIIEDTIGFSLIHRTNTGCTSLSREKRTQIIGVHHARLCVDFPPGGVPSFLAKGSVPIIMNFKRCVSFSLRDCNFLQMFSCEKNTAFFTDYFVLGKKYMLFTEKVCKKPY